MSGLRTCCNRLDAHVSWASAEVRRVLRRVERRPDDAELRAELRSARAYLARQREMFERHVAACDSGRAA